MNKYLIILNFSELLGGAEIRYLSLFNEIVNKKNDYTLILNRKLYDLAVNANCLDKNTNSIIIMEVEKHIPKYANQNNNQVVLPKPKYRNHFIIRNILKFRNQLIDLRRLLTYIYKLHLIFKSSKPDYVYAVWIGGMIAWPLKYMYKFKFVYSYMDSGFSSIYNGLSYPLKNERIPLKHADIIDFLSEDLFKGVSERIKLNKNTKIAITPCSFKNYSNIKPEKEKINSVVFASRLTPIKNPLLFLESIRLFNLSYENPESIQFDILGDGSCMPDIISYKNKHNLTNVFIRGHINNPIEYLKKSKIFISIQQSNNYPSQSLIEAMACENAIIASDVGETKKLVTPEVGFLVSLNAQHIADAIQLLFQNETRCLNFGKKARRKVLEEHTIERYMEHFYSLELM